MHQPPAYDPVDVVVDGFDTGSEPAAPRRSPWRWMRRLAVLLFFAASLAAAGWYAYPYRSQVVSLMTSVVVPKRGPVGDASLRQLPLSDFGATREAVDAAFQRARLWRLLKVEFADWYDKQLQAIVELRQQGKSDVEIAGQTAKALVALRRQFAQFGLLANLDHLKSIAAAFVDNIARLRKQGADVCFGFISQGEATPQFVDLIRSPEHGAALHSQVAMVFEAIAAGRKNPRAAAPPRQSDYNDLITSLTSRGWTQADLQLFSDERALARSAPDKVCRLVQEWFEAQLALGDLESQQRLLSDTLRPVVAG